MADALIPGVSFSIIDKSNIPQYSPSGRSVLIPFFSKYGTDEVKTYADRDQVLYYNGYPNYTKYHLGLYYVMKALEHTQKVVCKRLVDAESTFANKIFVISKEETNADIELEITPEEINTEITQHGNDVFFFTFPSKNVAVDGEGYEITSEVINGNGTELISFEINKEIMVGENVVSSFTVTSGEKVSVKFINEGIHEVTAKYGESTLKLSVNVVNVSLKMDYVTGNSSIKCVNNSVGNYTKVEFDFGDGIKRELPLTDRIIEHEYTDIESEESAEKVIKMFVTDSKGVVHKLLTEVTVFNTPSEIEEIGTTHSDILKADHVFKSDEILMFKAKGRGTGYNDICVKFAPARRTARFYSDINGVEMYPNTFLELTVYEKDFSGSYTMFGDPVVVSLLSGMEDGTSFVDEITGEDLWIHSVMSTNDWIEVLINEDNIDVFTLGGKDKLREKLYNALLDGEYEIIKEETSVTKQDVENEEDVEYVEYVEKKKPLEIHNIFGGSDGNLYTESGKINNNIIASLLREFYTDPIWSKGIYRDYSFDYIPAWFIENATASTAMQPIIDLADETGMALGILSCPYSTKYDTDLAFRKNVMGTSTYNSMLLSGQNNMAHRDVYTGKILMMPLSYYALENHLICDEQYGIPEPCAYINKGTLRDTVKLSYNPRDVEIEALRMQQINSVISESDGIYIIDQLTMYKKGSALNNINNVKVIHKIKQELPQQVKQYIQTRATQLNLTQINITCNEYMKRWLYSDSNVKNGALRSYSMSLSMQKDKTLLIAISVEFFDVIENININFQIN